MMLALSRAASSCGMRANLDAARAALRHYFGYPDFRPGQREVVASVISGADTLAVLPTGGGKSICYQVPALVRPGATVVISPLISLMKDQVDRLMSRGIAATFLNSTLAHDETRRRLASVERGIARLVYVAPERFEKPDVLGALERGGVSLLAIDEAHCISEWGHEFRPAFRRIARSAARFSGLQVVALTATATPAVRRDIIQQLRMRSPRVVVGGFDRPNLAYAVHLCRDEDAKRQALIRMLREERGLCVVYAATRASWYGWSATSKRPASPARRTMAGWHRIVVRRHRMRSCRSASTRSLPPMPSEWG
jgi:ATP-dependent DNA helicase RecQ